MTISQALSSSISETGVDAASPASEIRLIFLTNMVAPYWKPVFACLADRFRQFRVLVSTPMEANRSWDVDWDGRDVVVQQTITLKRRWRHPAGFSERAYIHFPVDTLRQLIAFNPDVIVSSEMGFRTFLALVYRSLWRKSKLIVWADVGESTEQGRGWPRVALRRLIRTKADIYVVPGKSGARYLERIGVEPQKIAVIPYVTDVRRFGRGIVARSEQSARRLLYVGQLIERKGLAHFIAALSKWASANPDRVVEFELCGDGPLRGDLERLPAASNLRLTFRGSLRYEDVAGVYAKAGIFVLPTLADCWGIAVNEAMASGLPVLGSSNSQAVSELVEPSRGGWVFRPDDSRDVDRAIDECMSMPLEGLDAMRVHARKAAMRLDPDYVAGLIESAACGIYASTAK